MPLMKGGYVYIMTNQPSGTLYIGVTADIAAVPLKQEPHCPAFSRS